MYFKHDGYHKERELGYRNNRGTRRRGCIPVFPCFATRYVTFGGVEVPRRIPRATKAHPILRTTPTKDNGPFLMVSFSSAPEMASSTTTSQAPRRRSPGPFTIFHEEITGTPTKPTRRLPSKSNKLTVSHSNKSWWRAQHYAMMQSKNTGGVQVLHTQIPPKQRMLG